MRIDRKVNSVMNERRENIEIDLKQLVLALWHRAGIILLVGVLAAALAFGYAYFLVTPMYAASTQLYVNNTYGENSPGFSSSQITAAQDLAGTYMVILESREVLGEVQKQTGLDYTIKQLKGMVSAAAVNETEVFEVSVVCADYKHAAQIANAIADILPAKIAQIVDGSSVRVVDYAVESNVRVSPSYSRYAMLGFLVGSVLMAAVFIALEVLDTTITSEEYLAQHYEDLPLLAVIPDAESSNGYGYTKSYGYYKGNYVSTEKKTAPKQSGGKK